MKFLYTILVFSSIFIFTNAAAAPLILTEDLFPGDFSTEVVDLQNFYNRNVDTAVSPTKVGEFGIETINATARFQNKFQRTILSPFKRLSTGNVEVMTRFKIATVSVKEEPISLKDPVVRGKLATLLNQTITYLDQEIDRRNYGGVINYGGGSDTFRGLKLPDAVARRVPGTYEINDRQGFYVDEESNGFYYEFPETTTPAPEQMATFSDAFQNYEYLQERLSSDVITIPLDEGVPQRVDNVYVPTTPGQGFDALDTSMSSEEFADTIFALAETQPGFSNQTPLEPIDEGLPLIITANGYGQLVGQEFAVNGRGLLPGSQVEVFQGNQITPAQTRYISSRELRVTLPNTLISGVAAIGLTNSPHSAIEIFVSNPDSCLENTQNNTNCSEVENDGISENKIVFDTEITITGENFTTFSNVVETSAGIFYNVPSDDGETIKLNIPYPFTVGEESQDHDFPLAIRILNENGISELTQTTAEFEKNTTLPVQENRGINQDGRQAENVLLTRYLGLKGQKVELGLLEGLVQKTRSAISEEGFRSLDLQSSQNFSLKEGGIKGFLKKTYSFVGEKINKVLVAVGLRKEALALPHGGYITFTYYCTCSSNYYILVAGAHGGAFVYQPGYSRLYANFNIFTTGVPVLGSYTPGTGYCYIYYGYGCITLPTLGAFDSMPGTGTGAI